MDGDIGSGVELETVVTDFNTVLEEEPNQSENVGPKKLRTSRSAKRH